MISKTLSWTQIINTHTEKYQLELAIHPFTNGKIIVNYPGAEGTIDGFNNKYKTLAEYIVSQKLASVVRIPNPYTFGLGWDINLRHVLSYVLTNSADISGVPKPEIYLMGTSAGAGAIALLAWEYPEVKKILLLEPAPVVGGQSVNERIADYKGEMYIVVGSGDEALGSKVGNRIIEAAVNASGKEIFVIPNCDHQFKGEVNGRIVSQAPFYAFSNGKKPVFPDKNAGIKLYD